MSDDLLADRYRRVRTLGEGGMGEVWLAEDLELGRQVAIKRLRVGAGGADPDLVNRMLREARVVARLNHPAIVTLHDLVRVDGAPYLIMEYVEGESLADRMAREGRLPWDHVAPVIADTADALDKAHDAGVLHRDVKPANILIDRSGRALLADFGIARGDDDVAITKAGELVGTVAYMPPEVARGSTATAASDVWSLGATFFAATDGTAPFAESGASIPQLLARLIHEDAPPPQHAGAMTSLVTRMLHTDPARRPTAAEVAREMRRPSPPPAPLTREVPTITSDIPLEPAAAFDPPTLAHPAPLQTESLPTPRRSRLPAVLAAGVGLTLIAGIAWLVLRPDDDGGSPSHGTDGTPTTTGAPPGEAWTTDVGADPRRPALSPNGRHLLVANTRSGTVTVLDPATGEIEVDLDGCPGAQAPSITPDGTTAVVSCAQGQRLLVIDLTANPPTSEALPLTGAPGPATLSSDGTRLLVPLETGDVVVYVTATREQVGSVPGLGAKAVLVALSPDGGTGYATNRAAGTLTVFDVEDPASSRTLDLDAHPTEVIVSPDGAYLYGMDTSGRIAVVDLTRGAESLDRVITFASNIGRLRIDPMGRLWVPRKSIDQIDVVDPDSGQVLDTISGGTFAVPAVFSADTAYVPDDTDLLAVDLSDLSTTPLPFPGIDVVNLVITDDGASLYVVGRRDGDKARGTVTRVDLR